MSLKIIKLTFTELEALHLATNKEYFKINGGELDINAVQIQGGKYIIGVKKLLEHHPYVDISGFPQEDYVQESI